MVVFLDIEDSHVVGPYCIEGGLHVGSARWILQSNPKECLCKSFVHVFGRVSKHYSVTLERLKQAPQKFAKAFFIDANEHSYIGDHFHRYHLPLGCDWRRTFSIQAAVAMKSK